jgi:UDP-N-acetylmuramyl pentapeptide phosphotransferase/UDP-N-acetylglucosamine-1-phosphate transferase
MTTPATAAVCVLVAGVVAWLVAARFRAWALSRAWLDVPNDRSSHTVPTPRGGGVGILCGFGIGLALWAAGGGVISTRAFGWLAGALLVSTVSFVDDIRPLSARLRLTVHVFGAVLLAVAGVQERDLPVPVALAGAFLWVVLLTNVYNFMDGIDGLAAAQSIVAGAAYLAAGSALGNPLIATSGGLLAGASAGFLAHNTPPARLFMGDVGATFLGFTFAALPLLANLGVGGRHLPLEFGVAAMAPFLFDALVTLGRRILRGERWFEAHRSHYYQRLVQAGLTHGRVTCLYTASAAFAALVGLATLGQPDGVRQAGTVVAFAPMLGIVALVWRLERSKERSATKPPVTANA